MVNIELGNARNNYKQACILIQHLFALILIFSFIRVNLGYVMILFCLKPLNIYLRSQRIYENFLIGWAELIEKNNNTIIC